MSAITEQKKLISQKLLESGISRIATELREHQNYRQSRIFPWAAIISDTANFEVAEQRESVITEQTNRLYKQMRCQLIQPFVVQIFDRDELKCTDLMEKFVISLPFFWHYQEIEGLIEPIQCEHSDYASVVFDYYESALRLQFMINLGPPALKGKRIQGINID